MTRIVSSSFQGATQAQVDVARPTFTEVLRDAIGDLNATMDYITGDNSPTVAHTHEAQGTGCPVGLPLSSGEVYARASVDSVAATRREFVSKDKAIMSILLILDAKQVRVPPGESSIRVEWSTEPQIEPSTGATRSRPGQIYSFCVTESTFSTMTIANCREAGTGVGERGESFGADYNVSPSSVYVVGICVLAIGGGALIDTTVDYATPGRPRCSVYFPRRARASDLVMQYQPRALVEPPRFDTTTALGGSSVLAQYPLPHAAHIADGNTISPFVVNLVSRAQNAATEIMTAAPAGMSDAGLTLADHTSGTYRAFHDHSASSLRPNEDPLIMPIFAEGMGTFGGAGESTDSMNLGGAPYEDRAGHGSSSLIYAYAMPCLPDVPLTDLECRALIWRDSGANAPTATLYCSTSSLGSTSSNAMTVSRIGSTNWYTATVTNPSGTTRGAINAWQIVVVGGASSSAGLACWSAWIK